MVLRSRKPAMLRTVTSPAQIPSAFSGGCIAFKVSFDFFKQLSLGFRQEEGGGYEINHGEAGRTGRTLRSNRTC